MTRILLPQEENNYIQFSYKRHWSGDIYFFYDDIFIFRIDGVTGSVHFQELNEQERNRLRENDISVEGNFLAYFRRLV